jgi:hypothetical protein
MVGALGVREPDKMFRRVGIIGVIGSILLISLAFSKENEVYQLRKAYLVFQMLSLLTLTSCYLHRVALGPPQPLF